MIKFTGCVVAKIFSFFCHFLFVICCILIIIQRVKKFDLYAFSPSWITIWNKREERMSSRWLDESGIRWTGRNKKRQETGAILRSDRHDSPTNPPTSRNSVKLLALGTTGLVSLEKSRNSRRKPPWCLSSPGDPAWLCFAIPRHPGRSSHKSPRLPATYDPVDRSGGT